MSNETTGIEKQRQLGFIEDEIETAKQNVADSFAVIGNRLKEIQESKLYKTAGFNSFEDYCQTRWQMKRAQAYRLISAVATINKLSPNGDNLLMPAFQNHECTQDCFEPVESEAIARELGKIKDIEELHQVWQQVNKTAKREKRAVTARDVEETFKDLPRFRELTTTSEFENLLPRPDDKTLALMEESMLEMGIFNRLIVWNGLLVDGYLRYRIAQKHNLPFRVIEMNFASENAAKIFKIDEQLGRKNLSAIEIAQLEALDAELKAIIKARKAGA